MVVEKMIDKNHMCKLCDGRVMYGFDYLGNTCGNKKGSVNLESYNVRYWQNPKSSIQEWCAV